MHADPMDETTDDTIRKLQIVAHDLFMLCRRASVAIDNGDVGRAYELLSHAKRIAGKVGIKESIIRAI